MATFVFKPNPNKIVKISKGKPAAENNWKSLDGINRVNDAFQLYMENDITLSVNNDYEDPFKEIIEQAKKTKFGSKIVDAYNTGNELLNITSGIRLQTEYTGAEAWKGSSKIEFDLSFNFYMGSIGLWSGREEVYNPIAALGALFMPRKIGPLVKGPGPSYAEVLGNNVADLVQSLLNPNQDVASDRWKNQISALPDVIAIDIGGIYSFESVIPKNFSFSFSKDLDDKGFPISGQASVHLETTTTGTSTRYLPRKS